MKRLLCCFAIAWNAMNAVADEPTKTPSASQNVPKSPTSAKPSTDSILKDIDLHPDVLAAQAEVKLAESRLAQVRMKVGTQIVEEEMEVELASVRISQAEVGYAAEQRRLQDLLKNKGGGDPSTVKAHQALVRDLEVRILQSRQEFELVKLKRDLTRRFTRQLLVQGPPLLITKIYPVDDIEMDTQKLIAALRPIDEEGIGATIEYFTPNKTLVIHASQETHTNIAAQIEVIKRLSKLDEIESKPEP